MYTHGLVKLPHYIDSIKSGETIPDRWPEIITESRNTALIKGNWTFGQVTVKFATDIAIKKAKKNDVSVVSGVQVTHTGRIGYYAEMAAAEKLIFFMFSGGFSEEQPSAIPYGGKKPVLSSNPFTMGFPAGEQPPRIADFATTACSGMKAILTQENNKLLPGKWICDAKGNLTNSPKNYKDGDPPCDPKDYSYLIPFGGHKGYAIMLANEFLGRIFSGADLFTNKGRGGVWYRNIGLTIITFKADLLCSYKEYASRIDEMERRIREIPPAKSFKEVLIPGDNENKSRKEKIKNGIPINGKIWRSLIKMADSLV